MLPFVKPYKNGYVFFNPRRKKYQKLSAVDCEIVEKYLNSIVPSENGNGIFECYEVGENIINTSYSFISMVTPLKVFWDITNECNARCIHCFTDAGVQSLNELTTEQVLVIIDQLYELGIMSLAFSGGEPFVRRDMIQIIKYATEKGFIVSITTNGSLLNADKIDFLIGLGIKSLTFSLDGYSQETFEKIRKGVDFRVLIDNIKYAAKQARKSNVEISVRTTLNYINLHEVFDILDFCSVHGVASFKVNNTNLWGRAKKEPALRLEESVFKDTILALHNAKGLYFCKVELPIEKYLSDGQCEKKENLGACTSTIDTINIFPNGDVGACGFCERNIIFGNVNIKDIRSILVESLPFDFDNEVCNKCGINKYKGEKKLTTVNHFVGQI